MNNTEIIMGIAIIILSLVLLKIFLEEYFTYTKIRREKRRQRDEWVDKEILKPSYVTEGGKAVIPTMGRIRLEPVYEIIENDSVPLSPKIMSNYCQVHSLNRIVACNACGSSITIVIKEEKMRPLEILGVTCDYCHKMIDLRDDNDKNPSRIEVTNKKRQKDCRKLGKND